ncbi:hypothetical protein RFI_15684, partial [Reticulomyxa filosa]
EQIANAFEQHLPSPEDDIDVEEFVLALKSMKCDLEEAEMRKLFKYADAEGEGYVSQEDVCTFLLKEYSSVELQRMKRSLLAAIMEADPNKRGSSLIKTGDETRWSQAEISHMEEQMKEALFGLATKMEVTAIKEEVEKSKHK